MIAAEGAQTLNLNSEIAGPITEQKAKDPERNRNEHDYLLCQRDKEFDLRRIDPCSRKKIVDPLRPAYQIDRQCDDATGEHEHFASARMNRDRYWNGADRCEPRQRWKNEAEDNQHNQRSAELQVLVLRKHGQTAHVKDQANNHGAIATERFELLRGRFHRLQLSFGCIPKRLRSQRNLFPNSYFAWNIGRYLPRRRP